MLHTWVKIELSTVSCLWGLQLPPPEEFFLNPRDGYGRGVGASITIVAAWSCSHSIIGPFGLGRLRDRTKTEASVFTEAKTLVCEDLGKGLGKPSHDSAKEDCSPSLRILLDDGENTYRHSPNYRGGRIGRLRGSLVPFTGRSCSGSQRDPQWQGTRMN